LNAAQAAHASTGACLSLPKNGSDQPRTRRSALASWPLSFGNHQQCCIGSPRLELAAEHRDLAKRARRLAGYVGEADRGRLLRYAEDLEADAAKLDAAFGQ
jgi:hypothetical protein